MTFDTMTWDASAEPLPYKTSNQWKLKQRTKHKNLNQPFKVSVNGPKGI